MRWRALVAVMALVATLTPVTASATPHSATGSVPCGLTTAPTHYTHVVWLVLENVGYSVIGSKDAPYLNALATKCGLATNDFALTHPSLPNYVAVVSGSTQGITDDAEPSAHLIGAASIFSQLHGNWRTLVESMPHACDRVTSGDYAARHNPAVYFTTLARSCQRNDVPLSMPLNLAAAFTLIVPNICHDMHSCAVTTGDRWLARVVPTIITNPLYRSGSLALFITFDENDTQSANRVPLIVVAPSVVRATMVTAPLSHYSLLAVTESILGVALLGAARNARSMRGLFHLQ